MMRSGYLGKMDDQFSKKTKKNNPFFTTDSEDYENEEPNPNRHTFAPSITNASREIVRKLKIPRLENRYNEELKKKQQRLDYLRQSQKLKEDARMKRVEDAQMRRRKKKLGSLDYNNLDQDHFYKENIKWVEMRENRIRMKQACKMKDEIFDENLTFKPKINRKSIDILKERNDKQQRRKYFNNRREMRKNSLMKSVPKYPYKPNINKKSMKIMERKDRIRKNKESIIHIQFSPTKVLVKENEEVYSFKGFTAVKRFEDFEMSLSKSPQKSPQKFEESPNKSRYLESISLGLGKSPKRRGRSRNSRKRKLSKSSKKRSDKSMSVKRLSRNKRGRRGRDDMIKTMNYDEQSHPLDIHSQEMPSSSFHNTYQTYERDDPVVIAISPERAGIPPLVETHKIGKKKMKTMKRRKKKRTKTKSRAKRPRTVNRRKKRKRGSSVSGALNRTTVARRSSVKKKKKKAKKKSGNIYTTQG